MRSQRLWTNEFFHWDTNTPYYNSKVFTITDLIKITISPSSPPPRCCVLLPLAGALERTRPGDLSLSCLKVCCSLIEILYLFSYLFPLESVFT